MIPEEIIKAHAKEQEESVREVLSYLADALMSLDCPEEHVPTSLYMDYDEQDMLNAATILYCVCCNYAIKHDILTDENAQEKINVFCYVLKDTFGLDTVQETQVKLFIDQIKKGNL